MIAGMQNKTYY